LREQPTDPNCEVDTRRDPASAEKKARLVAVNELGQGYVLITIWPGTTLKWLYHLTGQFFAANNL
jgi:hypothetical protein